MTLLGELRRVKTHAVREIGTGVLAVPIKKEIVDVGAPR